MGRDHFRETNVVMKLANLCLAWPHGACASSRGYCCFRASKLGTALRRPSPSQCNGEPLYNLFTKLRVATTLHAPFDTKEYSHTTPQNQRSKSNVVHGDRLASRWRSFAKRSRYFSRVLHLSLWRVDASGLAGVNTLLSQDAAEATR